MPLFICFNQSLLKASVQIWFLNSWVQLQHYHLHLNSDNSKNLSLWCIISFFSWINTNSVYNICLWDTPILVLQFRSRIRITEFLRLEGTWRGCWSNFPLKTGLYMILDWVSQHLIQPDLENLQSWRFSMPLDNLFQFSMVKKFSLISDRASTVSINSKCF